MKVHTVLKARKAIPEAGIKVGDKYYWWKFAFRAREVSKTYPKPSDLTQSDFLKQLYDMQDRIAEFSCDTKEDFISFRDEIADQVEELKSECEEKLEAMPEHLRDTSSSGETLTQRIEALEGFHSDVTNIECDVDEEEIRGELEDEYSGDELEEKINERIAEKVLESIQELQNVDFNI